MPVKSNQLDRNTVVNILANAFRDNQSVRYTIKKDSKSEQRIKALMAYAYDICNESGGVHINEERNACLLYIATERKKTTLRTIWWDVKLIINAVGLSGIGKLLAREAKIHQKHPKSPFIYLWFIGVAPENQGQGLGSKLISSLIKQTDKPIYLETSNPKNLAFYRKLSFEIYDELDLGYRLFFLRNTVRG